MRPRHILLLGIMLILVAGLAVLLFGHRLGGACPPGSGILVVTYNIGDINGNRVEAEELAEILTVMGDPEIVFLQEVPYAGFAESVASLLPRDARRYTAYSRLIGTAVISAFPLSRAQTVTYPSPSSWYGGLLVTAEIGGADSDDADQDAFAAIAPLPVEMAQAMIQALAVGGANQPIGDGGLVQGQEVSPGPAQTPAPTIPAPAPAQVADEGWSAFTWVVFIIVIFSITVWLRRKMRRR